MVRPPGSCASAPIVDTLTAYKLVQFSDSQNQCVTGDAIVLTNVIMLGMGIGAHSHIDAAFDRNNELRVEIRVTELLNCGTRFRAVLRHH